ncbi:MAG: NFACT family protein [Clostridia bacterium]|nr:NFACT family protein [Clostridia bacterium]
MAFDGVVTKCVVQELSEMLVGGRIEKIFQPEQDEITINVRSKGRNLRLILSASPNYPRIHFTQAVRENPSTPPVFCMLLRKHICGGRVTGVEFSNFERLAGINIEAINEMGDITCKKLIIEIMGRHSNIILLNEDGKILDSIKHIDSDISSKREIMPARQYTPPPPQEKQDPESLDIKAFLKAMRDTAGVNIESYLLSNIKGFSPLLCREICHRSALDGKFHADRIDEASLQRLETVLAETIASISGNRFTPCIVYGNDLKDSPIDFHCLEITQFPNVRYFDSMSHVLELYYSEKDKAERLKQKKADLNKVLGSSLDRCKKKISIQQEKLREVSDREKLKLYGELVTANIYCIPRNAKKVSLLNYYSEDREYVDVPLDENLSPQENAQRYFKRYSKAKSAFIHTSHQLEESLRELEYLESVLHMLDISSNLQEISEIRQELAEQGYVSGGRKALQKKQAKASAPLAYRSSDGFDIYVGKNNKQNDILTMKLSSSNDIWLHTREIPGSHVILRKLQNNIPQNTLLEAAMIAAYHSKACNSSNVPVDYTQVKNVKKPSGAKPGMVIYDNFKTIVVTPDERKVKALKVD